MASNHPLDDIIWKALGGPIQKSLRVECTDTYDVLKFHSEVSPLSAINPELPVDQDQFNKLSHLVALGENAGLFLKSNFSLDIKCWKTIKCTPLMEMVFNPTDANSTNLQQPELPQGVKLVKLGSDDVTDMCSLVDLTKPGPFASRTYEMGEYFGLRNSEGQLVAMAGERLRIPKYTEISAVCTHPDHLGKRYAAYLLLFLINRIRTRDEIPFLHVRPENTRASKLYESLGFQNRVLLYYLLVNRSE